MSSTTDTLNEKATLVAGRGIKFCVVCPNFLEVIRECVVLCIYNYGTVFCVQLKGCVTEILHSCDVVFVCALERLNKQRTP